ncbi:hypothetical protein CHS0354_019888 [Potamilus streckersoni]|uniref:Uncharacterized protein n=1 Tax=Potamilus streckersoni TaxID=2493646 RepID=A0AAE0SMZ1_9BIVA|nr:hypothetical protein CHS0354_019888 [Potamilus streckersoni]
MSANTGSKSIEKRELKELSEEEREVSDETITFSKDQEDTKEEMDPAEEDDMEKREKEKGEIDNYQSFEQTDGEPFGQNFEEQENNHQEAKESSNDVNGTKVVSERDEDERENETLYIKIVRETQTTHEMRRVNIRYEKQNEDNAGLFVLRIQSTGFYKPNQSISPQT